MPILNLYNTKRVKSELKLEVGFLPLVLLPWSTSFRFHWCTSCSEILIAQGQTLIKANGN